LVHPHNVDIWRFGEYWSGADPVAVLGPHVGAATGLVIPAGTEAELEDIYRRVPLELGPLTLEPGFYSIAGHVNAGETDPIAYIGGQFSKGTDPRVNRGSAGWRETPDYGPPTIHFLAEGVFLGPIFYVVPVPEPTGWVLMMAAIVVCGTRGRVGRFPHI
jgi:hypothetical protein